MQIITMAKSHPDSVYEKIFSSVAKRISPTKEEAEREKAFALQLQRKLQNKFKSRAELFFVGSTARDTGIRGDRDIDLFIAFPKGRSKEAIVKEAIATVKKVLPAKWEMHYAEHPYLQAHLQGYKIEVVPCFKIEVNEGIISAVDRTPLHATYLQEHLSQKQKRDVRVLKALLTAHGIYGAELEVGGFSGLVCEYLILNYRSLLNLLREATKWQPPVVLDIEDYYDQEYEELKRKFISPLIIVDFIDRKRNAAAAIEKSSFSKFIGLSRAFLKSPSEGLFSNPEIKYSDASLRREISTRNLLIIQIHTPQNIISDILVPQLRKSENSVIKQMQLSEFRVFNNFSFSDEKHSFILLELESSSTYHLKKIYGPPLQYQKEAERFTTKHPEPERGVLIEGERIFIEEERAERFASQIIKKIIRNPEKFGIASYYQMPFKKAKLLEGNSLLYALKGNTFLEAQLARFFFKKDVIG